MFSIISLFSDLRFWGRPVFLKAAAKIIEGITVYQPNSPLLGPVILRDRRKKKLMSVTHGF